jgi:nucleoside-diphosphate-sugar epimerase
MPQEHVLLTGAAGFVGRALVSRLLDDGRYVPRAASRSPVPWQESVVPVRIGDLSAETDWRQALEGTATGARVMAVVHLAARVHVMNEQTEQPIAAYRRTNVEGTLNLARQAAAAGVRRFVFVSSVKVNGEQTAPGTSFTADDAPAPQDAYGLSKYEAEQGLWQIAAQTDMAITILRPPLVYGPGVKANFAAMMHWLARGLPLPLGAVTGNRRSLVALDNLVDLLATCIDHPAAANETFLAGDEEDLSTADLLRRIGRALGRPARLLPVPPAILQSGARLLGRADIAQRLFGSLQVDIGKTRRVLGWAPPLSVDEGLRRAAADLVKPSRQ